jgi:hypothetical protein
MPGGPPGLDQTSELTKKPVELEPPNTEEDFLSQNLGPIPVHINFEPSIPSIDFDIPKSELGQLIETEEFSSARISNGSLPLGASSSELLCTALQGSTTQSGPEIGSGGTSFLAPCLDETNTVLSSDNRDMISDASTDPHPTAPMSDVKTSPLSAPSNKVECLGTDSLVVDDAVGSDTHPLKPCERADGPRGDLSSGQAPQMATPVFTSTAPFGNQRRPKSIDSDPEIDIVGGSHSKTVCGNEEVDSSVCPLPLDDTEALWLTLF